MLANIIRTDASAHRVLPDDSDLALAVRVLARAQQDAVWSRVQIGNQLRSLLREYFPAALEAFQDLKGGLGRTDARTILAAAPTPAQAAKLTRTKLQSLLKRAGRQRFLVRDSDRLHAMFRTPQLRQPPEIEQAMGIQMQALLRQLDAACTSADELAEAVSAHFERHPDAEIIISFPGLGQLAGARVLAEIGDDRTRFADARGLKAYAGSAPVTRASGKKSVVTHRQIKNSRLAAVCPIWTLAAISHCAGARRHYDHRRAAGDWHGGRQQRLHHLPQVIRSPRPHHRLDHRSSMPSQPPHCPNGTVMMGMSSRGLI
jgi:transposase